MIHVQRCDLYHGLSLVVFKICSDQSSKTRTNQLCILTLEAQTFGRSKWLIKSIINPLTLQQYQFKQMSKAKTTHSETNKSLGLKRVGDMSAYFPNTHDLPLEAQSISSMNSHELSAGQGAAFIHIELGDHLKNNRNSLEIKSSNKKRKRSYCEPGNALVIKEVEEVDDNRLQVPQTNTIRVKSQPFNQPSSQFVKDERKRRQEETIIGYNEPINEVNNAVDYPSIQINQVERYAEYRDRKQKEKNSRQIKSSKFGGNQSVFMLQLSGSTDQKRLQSSHHRQKNTSNNIAAHDSSNLIFDPADFSAPHRLANLEARCTYIHTTVPQNFASEFDFKRQKRCCYPFLNPQYSLSLKTGDFVLNAKKQWGHINSHYILSANDGQYPEKGDAFLGHLEGSFFGSEFSLYLHSEGRPELVASIYYQPSISCCSTHYRKIQVYFKIPSVGQASNNNQKSLKEQFHEAANGDRRSVVRLVTKQPKWNEKHGVFILSFKGKSKLGSIKNMVLVEEEKADDYKMMFCKTGNHKFHLEVAHPMTPFIAMGILISSFDFKLCSQ